MKLDKLACPLKATQALLPACTYQILTTKLASDLFEVKAEVLLIKHLKESI